jgi:CHAD domain-containing protein
LLELLGEEDRADAVKRAVQKVSRLRAFHVFRQKLHVIGAPRKDVHEVARRILKEEQRLRTTHVFDMIEQTIWRSGLPSAVPSDRQLSERIPGMRQQHMARLERLLEQSSRKPRRKRLHAIRLHIKQIRYQTEWLPGQGADRAALINRLRSVQRMLGQYEELAEFRKWATKWGLTVGSRIKKEWKRARKRARLVPDKLAWLPGELAAGEAWQDREDLRRPRLSG